MLRYSNASYFYEQYRHLAVHTVTTELHVGPNKTWDVSIPGFKPRHFRPNLRKTHCSNTQFPLRISCSCHQRTNLNNHNTWDVWADEPDGKLSQRSVLCLWRGTSLASENKYLIFGV